jgi:hypothetical protein
MRQRFADQGKIARKSRVALQRTVARDRPNPVRHGGPPNTGEIRDLVNVDQDRRLSQAEIHRRHQALTASQEFRVVAMFRLERERVIDGGGGYLFEGGRLHGARVRAIETRLGALGCEAAAKL